MIHHCEYGLSGTFDDISMKVFMRLWNIRLCGLVYCHPWLFLYYGARVTIFVEFVKDWLQVPCVEPPVEDCLQLVLGGMGGEVSAVVHMIKCPWSHIMWDNYLLSGLTRSVDR